MAIKLTIQSVENSDVFKIKNENTFNRFETYPKVYQLEKIANANTDEDDYEILIRHIYNKQDILFDNCLVDEVEVDGNTYDTYEDLSNVLSKILFRKGGGSGQGGGTVQSIQSGSDNVTINNSDPNNPIISVSTGIESVEQGIGIIIDNTDPKNPVITAPNSVQGIQVNGVDQLLDPITKKVNITVDSVIDLSDYSTTDETADIIAQNYYDKTYIDNYIDNVELGVEGRVLTSQTLAQLNALADGIYIASTSGTYANGFTVPPAHFVKFKKLGTTWTIFQDVEIPAYNDSALQASVTKLRSDLDSFTADSPNLINSVGNFRGGSYNSSGAFLASNNQLSLQPFTILPNTTYTISGTSVSSNTRFVFRDANNTFISALNGNTSSVQTFTTPANAATVSINVATGTNIGTPENRETSIYHDTLMLNIGSSPRPFQYFGRYIKTEKYDILYVDGTNGSDIDNNGSASDYPLKTIAAAKKFASKKCTLILSRGDYNYTSDIFYFENVIGKVQHVVRFFGGIKITEATPVSTGSTVLQYSYNFPATWTASTYRLYQLDIPDANEVIADADRMPHHKGRQNYLDHTIMKSVASIQAVEDATKPCYFYDSVNKIFYFKKVSGSDLTINPVLIPTNIVLGNTTVGKRLMWSNLQFLGVPVSFTNVTGTINSVEFGLCNSGGTCKTDNANDLTFNNCVAYGSSNDGFNGAGTVYGTQKFANLTKVTFNNCWAHHCDDDGESHHGYCEVYWNNGLSEKNNTGNSPASGCHAVYTNSYVQNNIGIGFSVAGAALDGGVSTDAIFNSCFSQKNGSNYSGTTWTKAINCISRLPTGGHFSGITQKFNCVELNS